MSVCCDRSLLLSPAVTQTLMARTSETAVNQVTSSSDDINNLPRVTGRLRFVPWEKYVDTANFHNLLLRSIGSAVLAPLIPARFARSFVQPRVEFLPRMLRRSWLASRKSRVRPRRRPVSHWGRHHLPLNLRPSVRTTFATLYSQSRQQHRRH